MRLNELPADMRATPLRTYLTERLQSARGLGWEMPEDGLPFKSAQPARVRCPAPSPRRAGWISAWCGLSRWLGFAR
jgi:hypothetical protein